MMGKKASHAKTKSVHQSSTLEKGRLVEYIAARMHQTAGVKGRPMSLLGRGTTGRKREIDVLLTSEVAEYPVRVAIECKNEKARIGSERIDALIGKLDDIGIPTQQSMYISASGYTRDAIERATEELPLCWKRPEEASIYRDMTASGVSEHSQCKEKVHEAGREFLGNSDRFEIINPRARNEQCCPNIWRRRSVRPTTKLDPH